MTAPAPGLAAIEEAALDLGRLAGERITEALEREIVVEYKDETTTAGGAPTNPVSETDRAIEALLREQIAERFPEHGVIGEEVGSLTKHHHHSSAKSWVEKGLVSFQPLGLPRKLM